MRHDAADVDGGIMQGDRGPQAGGIWGRPRRALRDVVLVGAGRAREAPPPDGLVLARVVRLEVEPHLEAVLEDVVGHRLLAVEEEPLVVAAKMENRDKVESVFHQILSAPQALTHQQRRPP